MEERNLSIDIIRAIGLILIILAHSTPPLFISQFRCFDVPMMLFISGLTFAHKQVANYWNFISKRTKRLVFPVWIFLTLYFLFLTTCSLFSIIKPLSIGMVIDSYLMIGGIGYTWIILVFLLIMLCTPLLLRLARCIRNDYLFILVVVLFIAFQEVVYKMGSEICETVIYKSIIANLVYGMFFIYGLRLAETESKRERRILITFATLAMIVGVAVFICSNGFPIKISPEYKYPPRLYFLIWGLFMSVVCWVASPWLTKVFSNQLTLFIGRNTIWIYLWHIPLVGACSLLSDNWIIKFLILSIVSISICVIQTRVIDMLEQRYPNILILKYFKG